MRSLRLQHFGVKDILASLREPELSRGHRNMNFPKVWRASQELSQSIHPPGKAREAMGRGGVRIWRNVKLALLARVRDKTGGHA